MKLHLLTTFFVILLSSCKAYLDVQSNEIETNYMTFKYQQNYNELNYFSKVNISVDKEIFYTTHFTINLPKNIIYWKQLGNSFYYEYDSKQIIYIYTSYKNEGNESPNWVLDNVDEGSAAKYLEDYLSARTNKQWSVDVWQNNRITKLYTNGKYKILLYNIKEKNFDSYLDLVKTFSVQSNTISP